jgi:peptidyl-prolyl cis-trans isomerase C
MNLRFLINFITVLVSMEVTAFQSPAFTSGKSSVARPCTGLSGFMDGMQDFMKRFTMKATASHILIKGGAEAENKLEDLKQEIGDSPVKFAEAAAQYSACPSARSGGNLGEFGPGQMVKEFDTVIFNDELGVVHGPVKTQVSVLVFRRNDRLCPTQLVFSFHPQFGYHLILINARTE